MNLELRANENQDSANYTAPNLSDRSPLTLETLIDAIFNDKTVESSNSQTTWATQPSSDQSTSGPSEVPIYSNEPETTTLLPASEPINNNDGQQSVEWATGDNWFAPIAVMISDDPVFVMLPLTSEIINKPSDAPANNYLAKIKSLVSIERYLSGQLGQRYELPLAWQCIGPDGKIWQNIELRNHLLDERNKFMRLVNVENSRSSRRRTGDNFAFCLLDGCNCGFKPNQMPGHIEIVLDKIIRHLGIAFYCTLCLCDKVYPFPSAEVIRKHFVHCPFAARALAEAGTILAADTEWTSPRSTQPVKCRIIPDMNFDGRLFEFLRKLHQIGLEKGLFGPSTIESLSPNIIKSPNLSTMVQIFLDYEKSHPTGSKFKIDMMEDTFFKIQLQVPKLISNDPKKIFEFQIIERQKRKAVSVWRIEKVTALPEDKKCIYNGCDCENKFTTEDADVFAGHILQSNFLVVCCKCSMGFMLWDDFENHLSEFCLIERITNF